jgi:hypothetical protein
MASTWVNTYLDGPEAIFRDRHYFPSSLDNIQKPCCLYDYQDRSGILPLYLIEILKKRDARQPVDQESWRRRVASREQRA